MKQLVFIVKKIVLFCAAKGIFKMFSDKRYLKIIYWAELGKKLNLENPKTFNEKLNWKKIYDRNPIYTVMADKYLAKEYVKEKIGAQYIVPIFGVWNSFEEIPFEQLPKQFVLKTTHDSGGVYVCRDKKKIDMKYLNHFFHKHLKINYFWWRREWPYKDIKPRIIAEEYLENGTSKYLPVYKFFCFRGEPKIVQTIQNDKQKDETVDYFDLNWNLLELKQNFPNSINPLPKPECLEEMITIAKKLSAGFDFIRVDLYLINGMIKFSEFTFYSDAGINVFTPDEWDLQLGKWMEEKCEN